MDDQQSAAAALARRIRTDGALCGLIVGIFLLFASQAAAQDLHADKVYGWDFQRADDSNFDSIPDGWKRRQDRLHPAYIDMRIEPRDAEQAQGALAAQATLARLLHAWDRGSWDPHYIAEAPPPLLAEFMDRHILNNCFQITMDGGAAEMVGPRFPMDCRFSYSLRAEASCQGLNGHSAWAELHLLDEAGQTLDVLQTEALQGTQAWQPIATDPAVTPGKRLKWGQVHLKVEPRDAMLLAGIARFDAISIYRMPRLSLSTPLPYHVVQPSQPFEVNCMALGISQAGASVRFELRDFRGHMLQQASVPLRTRLDSSTPAGEPTPEQKSAAAPPHYVTTRATKQVFDGQAVWPLQLEDPGLYRVKVNLGRALSDSQQREMLLAVMPAGDVEHGGPFGWSLPEFGPNLQPEEVPDLVRTFGAGWVKLPVWFDPQDTQAADRLVTLTERLQALGTECVGRLDQPPAAHRDVFGAANERLYASNVFHDPSEWEPLLEPVLTRMGMKLTWFQLGADDDSSFMGDANLAELLSTLRARMQTYSQELRLAFVWTWLDTPPTAVTKSWNAVHYTAAPQLTAQELPLYARDRLRKSATWVSLDPLDNTQYRLLDRVRDLTERMIAIKNSPVTAAFVSNPFRPELGLFTAQKSAGDLLIPWHNLVSSIGAAHYIGSIELPGGSVNHTFQSNRQGIMLLWNDNPQKEQIFLGDDLQVTDIWGKTIPVERVLNPRGAPEQVLPVDAWPLIVRGVDLEVHRFRQDFSLEIDHLASPTGAGQTIPLLIENTLPQNATGKLALESPTLLKGQRAEMYVQLPTGSKHPRELPVLVRSDASAGSHQLRFDLDLAANKPYRFSIYRSLNLGLGDLELLWEPARRDAQMVDLRVELQNNTTETVGFDCKLFPPGQAYLRFQLLEIKPGRTQRELPLRLPEFDGQREVWLRCEQLNSGRILNYRLEM
ncbi:MAG: hypothetical protein KDA45_02440 [Planctomycetales bacterium]|nr:hypothetical protein [Planctomycetales bacterium]